MNGTDTANVTLEFGSFRRWFMDKLLMGLTWPEYAKGLVTPFNIFAAIVLCAAAPVLALRYVYGLGIVTHASHDYPWGLLLGWGLFGGVPLSATGFVMATAYYIFGFRNIKPLVRLGVLAGFLGYLFAASYLMIDLGRPWRIYYPMVISYGPSSILFLVAWHVSLYLTVQLLEFSPAILEWLGSKRVHKWALSITIAMTIAGIILSTLHQSALGAMFLMVPGKLHPLWYSYYLPVLFLCSSIYAAFSMVIIISTLAARYVRGSFDARMLERLDTMTLALGKGAILAIYVYFVMKVVSVAHDNLWGMLLTPYGLWYLAEVIGFVLVPALVFTAGVKTGSVFMVRLAAFYAVAGILLNRLNVSIIAYNWQLPDHMHHIVPPFTEVLIVAMMVVLQVLVFRWILNRMPVLREEPEYRH